MKSKIYFILFFIGVYSCSKKATDYEKYLSGTEIAYPGTVTNLAVIPEYNSIKFRFNPSPDPSIVKYVVVWNYKTDSLVFPVTTTSTDSTIRLIIPNIDQTQLNTFYIYSVNDRGEYSIPKVFNNVRSIGSNYLNNLVNRPLVSFSNANTNTAIRPTDSIFVVFRGIVDTVNVKTEIYWTDINGKSQTTIVGPQDQRKLLPKFKVNTKVYYLSFYKPTSVGEIMYNPIKGRDSVVINQTSL